VYAAPLVVKKDKVSGPYLDNRAGVWSALRVFERGEDVAVVFTPGEEHSGRGALLGARLVHEELRITRALISDITWHTEWIKNGKGPAVSFRDRSIPRQRFLDLVIAAAVASGVPFQREVESNGGSDGSAIERSTFPIDWVFVGAPQKHSHTPREECHIPDLHAMVELYLHLVPALSR
jgi:putative aminopeptidase FrvX